MLHLAILFTITATLTFANTFSFAQNRPLDDLTGGEYPKLVETLGEVSYLPETLYKLAKPQLLYIDQNWLVEKGYKTSNRLTPAMERKILDALAYAAPVEGESRNAFTKESKTFYADYYGGDGLGYNRGSGRAASKGEIQIKGGGPTKMVHHIEKKANDGHNSGVVDLYEGFYEVIASQIAHQELPYGANRVVALIGTGTWVVEDGLKFPRVIIVREDPLRPAHFIINEASRNLVREKSRLDFVMSKIDLALPQAPGSHPSTPEERIRLGMDEFLNRHARVAAFSYANHFLHAAFSSSNEELSGAALDYGAFMALKGYEHAGRPDDKEMNGDTNAVETVIKEFIRSLRDNLPTKLRGSVPTLRDALAKFKEYHLKYLRYEMLSMTGAPPEFLKKMSLSETKELADLLISMADAGYTQDVDALLGEIATPGHYDLGKILPKMANLLLNTSGDASEKWRDDFLKAELPSVLHSEIMQDDLRKKLVRTYSAFFGKLRERAMAENIDPQSLRRYLAFNAEIRNRQTSHLIHNDLRSEYWTEQLGEYERSGDTSELRNLLDKAIRHNRRTFRNVAPYTLVLSEKPLSAKENQRVIFDLRKGITETIKVPISPIETSKGSADLCAKSLLR